MNDKDKDIKSFVPADGFDESDAEEVNLMSDPKTQLLIGQIMDWAQDSSWPDTSRILDILHKHEQILIPYIKDVLRNQDPEWKEWILTYLVAYFPNEYIVKLKEELELLVREPGEGDEYEKIKLAARKLYENI